MYYDKQINMHLFTDIEYIQIGLANTFGIDHLDWSKRLLWVTTKSMKELWSLADKAKEKYQYIKAMHALEDARKGIATGYTVGLDGTASGAQMFACISGCHITAKAVNLIGDGIRHDLYTDVGKEMRLEGVVREQLKQAIMTVLYQSESIPQKLFGNDVNEFYKTMQIALPGAWDILEYCMSAQNYIDKEYSYPNPSGHKVVIRQKVVKEYKVEAKTGYDWTTNMSFNQQRKEVERKVNAKGDPTDKGIGAHLAHTCDSWFANTLVDTCKTNYGIEVYHVFDQFFASPKHMNRVRWVGREILAMLAESDYAQTFFRAITGDENFVYKKHSDNLADEIRKCDYYIN